MNDLIKNILDHKTEKNQKLCEGLIELIQRYGFNTVEEIEQNEADHFTLVRPGGNVRMTDEEIQKRLYSYLDGEEFEEDFESCSLNDKAMIDLLTQQFTIIKSIDQKYINIINIFAMLDWDIFLPYHTYKYIVEGKL